MWYDRNMNKPIQVKDDLEALLYTLVFTNADNLWYTNIFQTLMTSSIYYRLHREIHKTCENKLNSNLGDRISKDLQ